MERFWTRHYPPGTPTDIDLDEFASLKQLFETSCERFADRVAFYHMDHAMTYRELERLSGSFAAWLQQHGFKRGDRLAIMLPNLLQYPVVMFGAQRAGVIVVNTNPLYTARELKHQLCDSGASGIVVLENFAATLQQVLPDTGVKHVIVTAVGDLLGFPKRPLVNFAVRRLKKMVPAWQLPAALSLRAVLAEGATLTLRAETLTHDDIAFLQYTGGTTGVAKGAMLTHGNLVANLLQARAWFGQIELTERVYVCALPLYHIFSLLANCLLFCSLGGTGVLITNPRDLPAFVKELRKRPPNFFMGVNTLFNGLMNTPGFESIDFKPLRITLGGGMAVQRAVADRWQQLTGCLITQAYGLTETSPAVCVNPLVGVAFNGSVGLPITATDVSIRDDAGQDVGINVLGEICVRGPQVMRGYWHNPEETAHVMLPDGWLRTGDLGRMDELGYVYIEDRKKDMINVSGFKVFPNEVEDVAALHPGVLEVAAVAEILEQRGESVALFVVKKNADLTAEVLIEHCRKHLTAYKLPRNVYFRDELPKTNVGKILRRALRDQLKH
ncbi:MAG: AMP-binding protein [Proteobacteria bacterium]|nr:AMP-binding protein [Pseudomonadota bacterium]